MDHLRLNLLGEPHSSLADAPLAGFSTVKTEALFYYLAVTGRPQNRETLADLLWGEMPEANARRSLAKALSDMRRLVAPYLTIERQTVAFNLETDYQLDVAHFRGLVEGGLAESSPARLTMLSQAVALYRGEFLAGMSIRNTPAFEAWLLSQREQLREMMIQALAGLTEIYIDRADLNKDEGLAYTGRLLALDPRRESAHRQMMTLLAQTGQQAEALAQYETCRRILHRELGVEPLAETTALYERLKGGSTAPHNLPTRPGLFVGREAELSQLADYLAQPACRLLTIIGPGGIGKTRLALQGAARYLAPDFQTNRAGFPDGIYFVNLTPVPGSELKTGAGHHLNRPDQTLATAMAEALSLAFLGPTDLLGQVLNQLKDKQLLLIIDNFELFSQEAEVLARIISAAPRTRLLVTSRERLNLMEEWVIELEGLTYPRAKTESDPADPLPADPTAWRAYSAVDLFVQLAGQVRADFSLSDSVAAEVIGICRLVEGAPLALELAASWLRSLTCAEVAAEIAHNLDFLTTTQPDIPPRHRSLRAVFEQSWAMLSADEQRAFARLSVFHGSFQREAAQKVANAQMPILIGLVDKSLLRLSPGDSSTAAGRYETHELLRQYAAEKLADNPTTAAATHTAHAHYYANFLQTHEQQLMSREGVARLKAISPEIPNFRAAWQWMIAPQRPILFNEIFSCIWSLRYLYARRGWSQEALRIFGQAAQRLEAEMLAAPPRPEHHLAYGQVLLNMGIFTQYLGDLYLAADYFQRSLAAIRRSEIDTPGAVRDMGLTLHLHGIVNWQQGLFTAAEKRLAEGQTYFQQINHQILLARSATFSGIVAYAQGEYYQARRLLQAGVQAFQPLGEFWYMVEAYGYLAQVNSVLGESLADQKAALADCLGRVEATDNPLAMAHARQHLGATLRLSGGSDLPAARRMLADSVNLYRTLKMAWGMVPALHQLALAQVDLNDDQAAEATYREALEISRSSQLTPTVLAVLLGLATLLVRRQNFSPALLEGLTTLLTLALNHPAGSYQVQDQAAGLLGQLAEVGLPHEIVAVARDRGRSVTIDAMVEEILHDLRA